MDAETARIQAIIENAKRRGRLIRRVQTAGAREAEKDAKDNA